MAHRHRSSESGQFVNAETAQAKPDTTVSERVRHIDTELLASRLYYVHVGDEAVHWEADLSQEIRDVYRRLAKVAKEVFEDA